MSHSNSSLNTYSSCQMKYKLNYIDHVKPPVPTSPHLVFGTMAHDVLYKAGKLRDECNDGVVDKDAYYNIIPSELLYEDLKETFGIKSWHTYFTRVIKQIAQYENDIVKDMRTHGDLSIERELKMSRTYEFLDEPFVGVIDLLIIAKDHAVILDYKFSSGRKTQEDFDMNSQLPLYAKFVHEEYNVPLRNIMYGYIDIPKKDFDNPILLTNGTLSRSKSQNCSAEIYEQFVKAIHGDNDPKYNCNPGGYYYDCYCELKLNKPAYLSLQWLDKDVYENVNESLMETAIEIDRKNKEHRPYLRKFDSYSCKGCDYLTICKPYLGVGDKNG